MPKQVAKEYRSVQNQTITPHEPPESTGELRLETARTLSELPRYAEQWDRLALQQPQKIPFLTHGWTFAHLQHLLSASATWVCLFALLGAELVGVLPLEVDNERRWGIPIKVVRGLQHSHSYSYDFITTINRGAEIRRFLLSSLNTVVPDWDLFQLSRVPEQSQTVPFVETLPDRMRIISKIDGVGSYQPTVGDYDAYIKTLSSNFSDNLRRRRKKLQKLPDVRLEITNDVSTVQSSLDKFIKVESAGWKGRGGSAIGTNKELVAFYQQMAEELSKLGILEWHFLYQGEQVMAAQCAVRMGDTVTVMKMGYDEAFADYAPGNMLVDQVGRSMFADQHIDAVNWLSDMNWHKNWKAKYWTYYNYGFCRPNLTGKFTYLMETTRQRLAKMPCVRQLKRLLSSPKA